MIRIAIQEPGWIHDGFKEKRVKEERVPLEILVCDPHKVRFAPYANVGKNWFRHGDGAIEEINELKKVMDDIEIIAKSDGYGYSLEARVKSAPIFTEKDKSKDGNGLARDFMQSDDYEVSAQFKQHAVRIGDILKPHTRLRYEIKIQKKGELPKGYTSIGSTEKFYCEITEFARLLEGALKTIIYMKRARDGFCEGGNIDLRLGMLFYIDGKEPTWLNKLFEGMYHQVRKYGNASDEVLFEAMIGNPEKERRKDYLENPLIDTVESFDAGSFNGTILYTSRAGTNGEFRYSDMDSTAQPQPNIIYSPRKGAVQPTPTFNPNVNYVRTADTLLESAKANAARNDTQGTNKCVSRLRQIMPLAEKQLTDEEKVNSFRAYISDGVKQAYGRIKDR